MPAAAGPYPWSEGFRRANKRTAQQAGVEWHAGGWRNRTTSDWEHKRNKDYERFRTFQLKNGKKVRVPDDDYDDFFGFTRPAQDADADSEIIAYIDEAKWTQQFDGVGHIAHVMYAPMRQLLRVKFKPNDQGHGSDDEVCYFRVPKEIYYELEYLSKDPGRTFMDKRGVQRHVIGGVFWDLIRIRGTRSQSRYKYEYLSHGVRHDQHGDERPAVEQQTVQKLEEENKKRIEREIAEAEKKGISKEHVLSKEEQEDKELYDLLANNLEADQKVIYAALATNKQREKFLIKNGVFDALDDED